MPPRQRKKEFYFDVAATSRHKPPSVVRAVAAYAAEVGVSHGRGAYRAGVRAGEAVFRCRRVLAKLFGVPRSERLVFTKNATEAANAALKGILRPGDHVVLSGLEHNAVIRPLNRLRRDRGVEYTLVAPNDRGRLNPYDFEKALRPATKLVCLVHASNVTGGISPAEEVGAICRRKGVGFLLDVTQTAGALPVDVRRLNADFLVFTGHKGLMGPPGTGGLAVSPRFDPDSLLEGGTGSHSDREEQPDLWPDKFEAGTLNTWGLAGLTAAVEFLLKKGVEAVGQKERALTAAFLKGVSRIPGVRLYGPPDERDRVAVVSLNVEGFDPSEVGFRLDEEHGMMVRAGLHCAPLAHRAIGTYPVGTVRFSFGYYNTESEVDLALRALRSLAKEKN